MNAVIPIRAVLFALIGLLAAAGQVAASDRPNVVMIMTDNHGAWTLGCYGNPDIRTPNIDRLALEGTRFTRAFSSNPVCSPTRATFLTGLVPSQHGVHCFLVGGRLQIGTDARNTLREFTSLPEVLRDAGYSCGLVGKWHLGDNLHPQEGFDDYWITMPHGGTSTFYGADVIENGRIRKEPQYLTDFWTRHAVKFIEKSAHGPKPFFLFLSYNGPYSLGGLLLREGQNRHAAYYADQPLSSFPRARAHPWQFNNLSYINNPVSIRRVATEVSGVDDGVGTVMRTLQHHGLDENTIVVFVADQGWVGGHGGFFGMGDHTRPVTARDGMMRIPMIWRHPRRIAAHKTSNRMVTNYDFLPTLLSYLDLGEQSPAQPKSPGRDFSDELRAATTAAPHVEAPVFYEFEGLRCIRTERWKYVHRHPNGPHELFDLANDPDEFHNLVAAKAHAPTRDDLKRQLDGFFAEHAQPKYDLWRGGQSQTRIFVGVDEEIAQTEPIAPPPLAAGFVPAEIHVPEGFTVELAAGPPLVEHPTFATFDDQGRLFVSENAGVNMTAEQLEASLPNSIRLLEDRDGDGTFDKSTVFADKMTFPMGGAWHDGALYVASPPHIWRLEDTDGDGVADQRDILVGQFGYTGNAASIHGCIAGPDGRLYWCDGYHGHEFKDQDGRVTSRREGSYIFSCWPDGSDVRLHSGGGMDNPVEVDFTDEGEMLGTVNIFYTRPRVDCLVHWLHGGAYPHRQRVLDEIKVTGQLLGPVHRFGHVAISGVQRYRSGVLDHRWRDDFFATFFNSGKVVRVELVRDGATYRATQREFLSSTSREFHPTDIAEDADGSLLVVDTGGWFYRGCPTSQYAKPDLRGAIYRVRRQGMTPQVDPRGNRINWRGLTNAQLVRLLNDTRFAVRQRVIAECATRGAAIVALLDQTIRRRDVRQQLGAVWALTRLVHRAGGEDDGATHRAAQSAIRRALADVDPRVQLAACRSIFTNPDPLALDGLLNVLDGDVPAVRREAAAALGRLGERRAVPPLLKSLARDMDRAEQHAVIYALIEINDAVGVRPGLQANDIRTRSGALIALDQMDAGDLKPSDVLPYFASEDASVIGTATDVFVRHADWSGRASEAITRLLERHASPNDHPAVIRRLVARFVADAAVGELLGRQLHEARRSPELRDLLLDALSQGRDVPYLESWGEPLSEWLVAGDPQLVSRAVAAVATMKTDRFRALLERIGADDSQPVLLRASAWQVAAGRPGSLPDPAFELLLGALGSTTSGDSLAAAQTIGSSALSKPQLIRLAPNLTRAGPAQLRELVRPFERSREPEVANVFLGAMEDARGLTSLAEHEFSDVIKRYPQETLVTANTLLDRVRQAEQQRVARLDELLPLLAAGDPRRGRRVFFSEKAKCATCHRVGELGERVGPDLTTIGANRAARDLLESIVLPSATIVRDYESHVLTTVDGRVLNGLITSETGDTLVLQQQIGDPVAVPRADIDQLMASTVSIMPNGLEEALTKSELADVIAYLLDLKHPVGRATPASSNGANPDSSEKTP